MSTTLTILRRFLLARAEIQAALLATFDLMAILGVVSLSAEEVAGVNMAVLAWMALASRLAFNQGLQELARLNGGR